MLGYRFLSLLSICVFFYSCTSSSVTSNEGSVAGQIKIPYSEFLQIAYHSDHSLLLVRDLKNSPELVIERYSTTPSLLWSTSIPFDSDSEAFPLFLLPNSAEVSFVSSQIEKDTLYIEGRRFAMTDGKEQERKSLGRFVSDADDDKRTPYRFLISTDSSLFAFFRFDYEQVKERQEIRLEIHTYGNDLNHIRSDTLAFHTNGKETDIEELQRLYFKELTIEQDTTLYALHYFPIDTVELWEYKLSKGRTRSTRFTVSDVDFTQNLEHITGVIDRNGEELGVFAMLSKDYSFYNRTISQFMFARFNPATLKLIDAVSIIPEYEEIKNAGFHAVSVPFVRDELCIAVQSVITVPQKGGYTPVMNWNDMFLLYCDSTHGLRWRERILNVSPSYTSFYAFDNSVELFYSRSMEKPFAKGGVIYKAFDRETGEVRGEQRLANTSLLLAYNGLHMIKPGALLCVLGNGYSARIVRINYTPL